MKSIGKRFVRKIRAIKEQISPNQKCLNIEVNNWEVSDFVLRRLIPKVGIHPDLLNEVMLMVGLVGRFPSLGDGLETSLSLYRKFPNNSRSLFFVGEVNTRLPGMTLI
jgi:hypothetical protein